MDTVTLIRSAIRGLLNVADAELEAELRKLLGRDDDSRRWASTFPRRPRYSISAVVPATL
jgi:hypothetical protein